MKKIIILSVAAILALTLVPFPVIGGGMYFALGICLLIIFALIFLIHHKIGVKKRIVILTGFMIFGIISGLRVALGPPYCGMDIFQAVATYWGDGIYEQSINHFGDPHSAFAHFTVPWFFRIPQIYFFAPAIIFSLTGLVIKIIFNLINKAPSSGGIRSWIIIVMLLTSFGVSSGIVYAKYAYEDKYPTQPFICPVSEVITQSQYEEWETWEIIASYEIDNLSFSPEIMETGQEVLVTCIVKNVGSEKGRVNLELEVESITASNEVALLPAESKTVQFVVIFPEGGIFMVRLNDLSEYIAVND